MCTWEEFISTQRVYVSRAVVSSEPLLLSGVQKSIAGLSTCHYSGLCFASVPWLSPVRNFFNRNSCKATSRRSIIIAMRFMHFMITREDYALYSPSRSNINFRGNFVCLNTRFIITNKFIENYSIRLKGYNRHKSESYSSKMNWRLFPDLYNIRNSVLPRFIVIIHLISIIFREKRCHCPDEVQFFLSADRLIEFLELLFDED